MWLRFIVIIWWPGISNGQPEKHWIFMCNERNSFSKNEPFSTIEYSVSVWWHATFCTVCICNKNFHDCHWIFQALSHHQQIHYCSQHIEKHIFCIFIIFPSMCKRLFLFVSFSFFSSCHSQFLSFSFQFGTTAVYDARCSVLGARLNI